MKNETFDAAGAGDRLAAAIEARRHLLHRAATGRSVTAAEFRAVEEHVRLCEQDAALANEVVKFTAAERDRNVISQFQDRADSLAKQMADRAAEHLAAARALDEVMAAARAAALRLDDARLALEETDRACHAHNQLLDGEAAGNTILSAQHRSAWPKARTAAELPTRFGGQLRVELVTTVISPAPASTGPRDVVVHQAAEDVVRGAHGTLPKPVKAAA